MLRFREKREKMEKQKKQLSSLSLPSSVCTKFHVMCQHSSARHFCIFFTWGRFGMRDTTFWNLFQRYLRSESGVQSRFGNSKTQVPSLILSAETGFLLSGYRTLLDSLKKAIPYFTGFTVTSMRNTRKIPIFQILFSKSVFLYHCHFLTAPNKPGNILENED